MSDTAPRVGGVAPDRAAVPRGVAYRACQLIFAPPKGGKLREVPLPGSVTRRLAAHAKQHPSVAVTLRWATLDGAPVAVRPYVTTARVT